MTGDNRIAYKQKNDSGDYVFTDIYFIKNQNVSQYFIEERIPKPFRIQLYNDNNDNIYNAKPTDSFTVRFTLPLPEYV